METQTLRKAKWFWPWDDEKEEAWLGEMARQGWHLTFPSPFGQYIFTAGAPGEWVYRLDFISHTRKDDSYFQLFRDAGWEHIGQLGGWQYFRKKVAPGTELEIFTDNQSKIEKYQRLLTFLLILTPIWLTIYSTHTLDNPSPFRIGILLVMVAIVLVYIYVMIGLLWRINQLRKG